MDSDEQKEIEHLWSRELEGAKTTANEVHAMINDRVVAVARGSVETAKHNASTRRKFGTLKQKLVALPRILEKCSHISEAEHTRRQDQIAKLKREYSTLEETLRRGTGTDGPSEFESASVREHMNKQKPRETERTAGVETQQLAQLQRNMMNEQDTKMDELMKSVSRLKNITGAVHDELETQHKMLEDLDGDMQKTQGRLGEARDKMQDIEDSSLQCSIC
ncbi:hypothetical protein CYMTET_4262 [Cymbomonas tetramitiformis]|uniref:t-SNARE coiled-coil homology domain-containing protein n=1 Tax=Cymbomonas tetramitiformis TaxID=36881 RepID=A0AAE0H3B1_9CHLO|nr:hypothetical protein CYMTET_4262 [Cymbomonas tetramitiformis]